MKTKFTILMITALAISLPGAAAAQQLFDFFGMTLLPAAEGGSLTLYAEIRDGGPAIETPLPLDFANYEYTLVVTDLVLVTDSYPDLYAGGAIALYEDAATPLDYAAPGTFSDGSVVLSGVVTSLELAHFAEIMPSSTLGNATGTVDWTGGLHLDDIAPEDQSNWVFLSATNSGSGELEPGYDEVWDGKVEPRTPIVSTDEVTWDAIKAMF